MSDVVGSIPAKHDIEQSNAVEENKRDRLKRVFLAVFARWYIVRI
jgi:hypothetical protein